MVSGATAATDRSRLGPQSNKLNKTFKDIHKKVSYNPSDSTSRCDKIKPHKLVKMNDYTKNISEGVFSPGELEQLRSQVKDKLKEASQASSIAKFDHHLGRTNIQGPVRPTR